jgi:cytosine/adenosine deaminase-related metal-dependent hydrolase
MTLGNVTLVDNAQKANINIKDGIISAVLTANPVSEITHGINFIDAIAFPGLINSHDHLDFNLFPQFGEKLYLNYTQWGKHIHEHYSDEIRRVLQVPKILRERWGIYKNLICGVTTVINHGTKLIASEKLINIIEDGQSLHSVGFEKWWKIKLNNPLRRSRNVIIHTGEGVDGQARKEIDTLVKWNLLKRNIIGIHGVAMDTRQLQHFKALVWCPQSNYFLLNATADINLIKKTKPVLFGTDSTLTSNWNIWDHIDFARSLNLLSDRELYDTLNVNPAKIWDQPCGKIGSGLNADIVVAKRKNNPDVLDAFLQTRPADLLMVMCRGEILLFDETLLPQLKQLTGKGYQKINVNGSEKYIYGDIQNLFKEIRGYQPEVQFPIEIIPTD